MDSIKTDSFLLTKNTLATLKKYYPFLQNWDPPIYGHNGHHIEFEIKGLLTMDSHADPSRYLPGDGRVFTEVGTTDGASPIEWIDWGNQATLTARDVVLDNTSYVIAKAFKLDDRSERQCISFQLYTISDETRLSVIADAERKVSYCMELSKKLIATQKQSTDPGSWYRA